MSHNPMTRVSLCLVIVLLALPARAGAQETTDDRWTPELSMRYFGVGGTTISPDGRYIAYTIRKPLMEGEKSEYPSHVGRQVRRQPGVAFFKHEDTGGGPELANSFGELLGLEPRAD